MCIEHVFAPGPARKATRTRGSKSFFACLVASSGSQAKTRAAAATKEDKCREKRVTSVPDRATPCTTNNANTRNYAHTVCVCVCVCVCVSMYTCMFQAFIQNLKLQYLGGAT